MGLYFRDMEAILFKVSIVVARVVRVLKGCLTILIDLGNCDPLMQSEWPIYFRGGKWSFHK